jgi:hypothetical protein
MSLYCLKSQVYLDYSDNSTYKNIITINEIPNGPLSNYIIKCYS